MKFLSSRAAPGESAVSASAPQPVRSAVRLAPIECSSPRGGGRDRRGAARREVEGQGRG